jgi:hypothetical protein
VAVQVTPIYFSYRGIYCNLKYFIYRLVNHCEYTAEDGWMYCTYPLCDLSHCILKLPSLACYEMPHTTRLDLPSQPRLSFNDMLSSSSMSQYTRKGASLIPSYRPIRFNKIRIKCLGTQSHRGSEVDKSNIPILELPRFNTLTGHLVHKAQ